MTTTTQKILVLSHRGDYEYVEEQAFTDATDAGLRQEIIEFFEGLGATISLQAFYSWYATSHKQRFGEDFLVN